MGLYEKELGIFIRSRASLTELRKHFRKFTRVQDEQGKWYYFRFWVGDVLLQLMRSDLVSECAKVALFPALKNIYMIPQVTEANRCVLVQYETSLKSFTMPPLSVYTSAELRPVLNAPKQEKQVKKLSDFLADKPIFARMDQNERRIVAQKAIDLRAELGVKSALGFSWLIIILGLSQNNKKIYEIFLKSKAQKSWTWDQFSRLLQNKGKK